MASDFLRIRDNVQKMIDQNAPIEDINGYLGTEGFTDKEFKLANENFGTFTSAVKRGGKGIGSLLADVLPAMGADLVEKIAPDSWKPQIEAYKQRQWKEAAATQEEIAKKYPAEFESFRDVEGPMGALGYAKEALGENITSIIPSVVTGGGASIVGRGGIAAAKMAAEDAAMIAARQAAQKGVPGAAEELISGYAGSQAAKLGAQAAARKALQYEAAGALAGSSVLNIPEAYQTLYSPENQNVLLPAIASGAFNALLDSITPLSMLRTIKGKGITGDAIMGAWYKRGAKELGKGVLTEGTTEAIQEMSNAAAEKYVNQHKDFFTAENLDRFINAGLKGGIGGGIMQGAAGVAFGNNAPEETPTQIPKVGPLTPAQAGATPLEAAPPFTPLTGERDLFGMVPEPMATSVGEMRPIIDPVTGKITGYEPAAPQPATKELTGEQLHLQPAEEDLLTGQPSVQPETAGKATPLVNEAGEVITPTPAKPIAQHVKDTLAEAKGSPDASTLIKANNPSTANVVAARIEELVEAAGGDNALAMEMLYKNNKQGIGKALSPAQQELLDVAYRRLTGRQIEDAVQERAFMGAEQGELFGGEESAKGKTEPVSGPTPPDVGAPAEQPEGTAGGAEGPGAGGVGVGGGEPVVGGPAGGEGQVAPTLSPEEVWAKHKNDDHPAYTELSPEERAVWDNYVARGTTGASAFQDVAEMHSERIRRESMRTPEEIEQALIGKHKPGMEEDIEQHIVGKTFDQVLNYLANHGPEANREIAKKMLARVKELRKVGYSFKFKVAQTPEQVRALGGYDSGVLGRVMTPRFGKEIDISVAGRNSGQPFGAQIRTVTHEALHAVTAALVIYGEANPKTPAGKIAKQLDSLSKYVLDYLTEKQRTVGLTPSEDRVLNQTNALGNMTHRGGRYNQAHEMISHGMTTPEMMQVLETIPYSKTKSVYSHFVELLRQLLGLAPKHATALSEVMRLTQEIMEESAAPLQSAALKGARLRSGPANIPAPGQPYNLPPLTKLQPAPTAGQQVKEAVKKVENTFKNDWWTNFRIAAVDPASGLMKTLSSLPIFSNGQLRADMLIRSFNQAINLIKNGLQSGIPVLNSDGSVVIERSENNMRRSQLLADELDANPIVKGSGFSGRGYVNEIARIKRGEEIMQEDAAVRAKAAQHIAEAKDLMRQAKALKARGGSITDILRLVNKAKSLRAQWGEAVHLNREKQVTQAHIDWADQQLRAVPEVNNVLNIWREINIGLTNLNEAVGNLDAETAERYRSKKYYVPLFASRVDLAPHEQEHYTGKRPGTKSVAKQYHLEGSLKERNIWENMDKHYASATASAFQNQTRKVAVQQLMSDGIDAARYAKSPDDPNINLRYRDPTNEHADRNGIVHVILDNPNDLAAFQMMHYELGPLMKGLSATTQVLRAGALINPMYWIKQLIRDPIHSWLVANTGIVTPFHAAKEYINVLANNSAEAQLLMDRGVIGQIDPTIDLHDFLKQVGTEKMTPSMMDKMIHKVMRMHEASDAATRVALFKKAKAEGLKQGMSEADATNYGVHIARESINFAVRGNSKTLNALRHMIPFFSAAVTSLDTIYRAATGYGLNPQEKKAAQTLFAKRAAMLATVSTVYAMMLQDDDDYKKLPDNVKDNNWLLPSPVGSGHSFIKIPIPFEVGFLFKTIPEGAVRYMAGTSTGKEMLASYGHGLLKTLPGEGVLVPQAVKPALEVVTNYSFFTGRPIEGMSDKGLPTEMRGPNASEAAKLLSKYGLSSIGLSPAQIDHLFQGYMAEVGTFTAGMASAAVNQATGKEPPTKNLEEQPFFKAFLTNPNTSKAATDFYDITHNAQEAVNAVNRMKKEGRVEAVKEFISDEENKKLMAVAPRLRSVQDNMAKIRARINQLKEGTGDPDARRDEINKLQTMYDNVARQGYKILEAAGIER